MTRENLFFEHGKFDWGRRIYANWKNVFIEQTKFVNVYGLDITYQFDTVAQAKRFIRRKIKEESRATA